MHVLQIAARYLLAPQISKMGFLQMVHRREKTTFTKTAIHPSSTKHAFSPSAHPHFFANSVSSYYCEALEVSAALGSNRERGELSQFV
jgi:hypothetical protein